MISKYKADGSKVKTVEPPGVLLGENIGQANGKLPCHVRHVQPQGLNNNKKTSNKNPMLATEQCKAYKYIIYVPSPIFVWVSRCRFPPFQKGASPQPSHKPIQSTSQPSTQKLFPSIATTIHVPIRMSRRPG